MTAALCQESMANNGHYLLIELLSAGREPKKSLVAPHDTTFYAFVVFFSFHVFACLDLDEKVRRPLPRFTSFTLSLSATTFISVSIKNNHVSPTTFISTACVPVSRQSNVVFTATIYSALPIFRGRR
jgi:hypothetical protein